MAGPASVFANANVSLKREVYHVQAVSSRKGNVLSSSGIPVFAESVVGRKITKRDTIFVVGGGDEALRGVTKKAKAMADLKAVLGMAGRKASICSGAFILASLGLLDGRQATTHWIARKHLQSRFPLVNVSDDALYVEDGSYWTSAGVTTGMDMALEMLRKDHGADLMRQVAKTLVVYSHRPGKQSQFSRVLEAQAKGSDAFADFVHWLDGNLDKPIDVNVMAEKVGMSPRTFHRKFAEAYGVTPSKFVDDLRLQKAKEKLEEGSGVKQVAAEIGYASEAAFRTAFKKKFGTTPSIHRALNRD